MKEFLQHPVYGEIIYTESFWTSKKTLTVNGLTQPITKKEFMIDEKKAIVKGDFFTGVTLFIEGETVAKSPKPKWYEIVLSVLSFIFLVIWGNNTALCSIFPVVGGAIGGALGGISLIASLMFMKKAKSPIAKVLIGIGVFIATILIAFVLAVAIIMTISL